MKKFKVSVAAILLAGGSFLLSSCIGNFALTKSVMDWNNGVGNKFVNELVFIAFWILPVYEVTSIADLLVLNSIEFWSGKNPLNASVKTVDTNNGRFIVECDGKGYTITEEENGAQIRFDFNEKNQTWSVNKGEESIPFMTFIDNQHVKMITPEGDFRTVELSEAGVMAYNEIANASSENLMAKN